MWKWKGNSGRYFSVQVANIVVLSVHGKGVNKIFTIWAFPHIMKITARFRWQFNTWRACRAGARGRAGCCWASPRGRTAAPRSGPGQPIRGEYCGDCWTNHSSPGGCSHPTRSRTQSSGSASSGHVEQWHWARIKEHWRERQHRHPAFSYTVGYLKLRCLCWTSAAVVPAEQNTEIMLESTQRYGSMVSDEAPHLKNTLHAPSAPSIRGSSDVWFGNDFHPDTAINLPIISSSELHSIMQMQNLILLREYDYQDHFK